MMHGDHIEMKRSAERFYRRARRQGRLVPAERCEVLGCGETERLHAHHGSYSRPYSVRWLCARHHRLLHVGHVN